MKLSKYNRIKYIGESTIIYNTATSGVLMLDKEYSEEFNKLKKYNDFTNKNLIDELKKAQMVIDDCIDEVKNVQVSNLINRFDQTKMSLTIAPTLNCNFAYPYCFKKGIRSFHIPQATFGICGAVSLNSYVVDPKGDLYKCWDEIGRNESCVGNVLTGVKATSKLSNWLLYNPGIQNKECTECDVLPICYGGCAYNFMQKGSNKCCSMKFNSDKVVELLYNDR